MLQSALEHYERQKRLTAGALVAARRVSWRDTSRIAEIIAAFQILSARNGLDSIDPMLDEQSLEAPLPYRLDPQAFAGTASDGRGLISLLEQAASPEALGLMVVTQVQDAGRQAAGLSIFARDVGYVRMLTPPSCRICVPLAGRWYRYNEGFDRHPKCDCIHIPVSEDTGRDLRTDPDLYFRSMSAAEQDKWIGKANAQGIRDHGADVTQILNAYRRNAGLRAAGEFPITKSRTPDGTLVKVTSEGSTKRGQAFAQQLGLRQNGPVQARVMPETIFKIAKDREHAERLLKLYGWIPDAPAISRGRAILVEARQSGKGIEAAKAAIASRNKTAQTALGAGNGGKQPPAIRTRAAAGDEEPFSLPNEVAFTDAFRAAGEDLRGISVYANGYDEKTGNLLPASDFMWTSRDVPTPFEHKHIELDTPIDYVHLTRPVRSTVKRSAKHADGQYTKRNYVLNIGDRDLPADVSESLSRFNQVEEVSIDELWVMTRGRLVQIHQK